MFKYSNTNKRYHTFDYYLKQKYNNKVFKVSLNAGFTCPNRDGSKGYNGCTFCGSQGAGENAGNINDSLEIQFEKIKNIMQLKWPNGKTIAYFQAFSNTYASVNKLKEIYEPFVERDDIIALSIATRADCLDDEIIEYLSSINKRKDLWIEIGLQTFNNETARSFNRGYNTSLFIDRVNALRKENINVTVHIINGLLGETKEVMIDTCKKLNELDIQGIKIHSLSILKDSTLGKQYLLKPFDLLSREDYIDTVIKQLEVLRPEIVIQRLTSDPIKDDLLAPNWNTNKTQLLNDIDKEMVKRNTYQGKALEKETLSKSVSYSHKLIKEIASNDKIAIDATLGNGYDSLLLSSLFKHVYSFDIQELAIKRSKERLKECNNITIIHDSHANMDQYIKDKVDLVLFNLGFLPGSDKKVATNSYTTITAIDNSLKLLNQEGLIIITGYSRHNGGSKEINDIEDFLIKNKYKYDKNIFDFETVFVIKN